MQPAPSPPLGRKRRRAHRGQYQPDRRRERLLKRLAITVDFLLRQRLPEAPGNRPGYSHELPVPPARALELLSALAEGRVEALDGEDGECTAQPAGH